MREREKERETEREREWEKDQIFDRPEERLELRGSTFLTHLTGTSA